MGQALLQGKGPPGGPLGELWGVAFHGGLECGCSRGLAGLTDHAVLGAILFFLSLALVNGFLAVIVWERNPRINMVNTQFSLSI